MNLANVISSTHRAGHHGCHGYQLTLIGAILVPTVVVCVVMQRVVVMVMCRRRRLDRVRVFERAHGQIGPFL